MKIRYFADTDTLYIEFRDLPVTRDSRSGREHDLGPRRAGRHLGDYGGARVRTRRHSEFSYEQVAAHRT